MSMHGYANRLLQETAAVVTTPAGAPSHGHSAASSGGGATPESTSNPSPYNPFDVYNSQFSPTLIIILVILLSSFVFMAFFAMYVRRCATEESFSRRSNSHGARRDELPIVGSGVDPVLIESFPIVSYAVAKKKGCNECVVCLADFEGGDELKQLPKCKHMFHPGCISSWLASHTTCPLCRRSLVNSDRWSMSLRWGGSSHGASLSARLNEGGSSHSCRGGDQTASPRLGRAGSSTGWQLWARGRNGDGSSRRGAQEDASARPSCDAAPTGGLPPSPLSSGLLPRGKQASPASSPHGFQASSPSSNLMPRGRRASPELVEASSIASEVATNVAGEVAPRLSTRGLRQTSAAAAGQKWLRRWNSTGHSLRKGAVSRAAMQATGGGGWATGCMPLSPLQLHRSRSVGLDGPEGGEVMVDPTAATSDQSPLSGGGWGSLQSPHEPWPAASTLAGSSSTLAAPALPLF